MPNALRSLRRAVSRIESLETRQLLSGDPTTPPTPPTTGIVVGNVFRDANGDGTRQTTEGMQSNVKVYLDLNNNGVRDGDAEPLRITDLNGHFSFEGVAPATALPVRLLLTGTNFVQTRPTGNAARVVTVVAGHTSEAEAFGVQEVPPTPPPATTGTIAGTVVRFPSTTAATVGQANIKVYLDLNNNGVRDGDAEPLTTTDNVGAYHFEHVAPATAVPIRLLLAGTNFVQTRPTDNAAIVVAVVAGHISTADAFGVQEVPPTPPPATTGTIAGVVFRDANGDGSRSTTEFGQPGIRVYLDLNNNGVRDGDAEPLTLTDNVGAYHFEHVAPAAAVAIRLLLTDTHFVQTLPADNAARVVAVTAGNVSTAELFGVNEIRPTPPPPPPVTTGDVVGRVLRDGGASATAAVHGQPGVKVYLDLDNDGTRDGDEPIRLTDGMGGYHFEHVAANPALSIRLLLDNTHFVQTRPTDNAARVAVVTAGKVTAVEPFAVSEVHVDPPSPTGSTTGNGPLAVTGQSGLLDADATGLVADIRPTRRSDGDGAGVLESI